MASRDTKGENYSYRLTKLEYTRWKQMLHVQMPYRLHLLWLRPGRTLDVGCGIGRYLKILPRGSVGIDHNKYSIKQVRKLGLESYTTKEFEKSGRNTPASFDTLLFSHVLEHLSADEGLAIIKEYAPLLKPNGKLIICCPQERGYKSDQTHVLFLDKTGLIQLLQKCGFDVTKARSFPLPQAFGKVFKYNEFVVVGRRKPSGTLYL